MPTTPLPPVNSHFARGEGFATALMGTCDVLAPVNQGAVALGLIAKAAEWLRTASGPHEAARLLYRLADRYGAEGAASSDLTAKTRKLDQPKRKT